MAASQPASHLTRQTDIEMDGRTGSQDRQTDRLIQTNRMTARHTDADIQVDRRMDKGNTVI